MILGLALGLQYIASKGGIGERIPKVLALASGKVLVLASGKVLIINN